MFSNALRMLVVKPVETQDCLEYSNETFGIAMHTYPSIFLIYLLGYPLTIKTAGFWP